MRAHIFWTITKVPELGTGNNVGRLRVKAACKFGPGESARQKKRKSTRHANYREPALGESDVAEHLVPLVPEPADIAESKVEDFKMSRLADGTQFEPVDVTKRIHAAIERAPNIRPVVAIDLEVLLSGPFPGLHRYLADPESLAEWEIRDLARALRTRHTQSVGRSWSLEHCISLLSQKDPEAESGALVIKEMIETVDAPISELGLDVADHFEGCQWLATKWEKEGKAKVSPEEWQNAIDIEAQDRSLIV
ncbi:hypothetical protein C8J57DRAFT_1252706 [Mycena rebaudengoi]|nr:hypothetical protein C8J57DRAFT_1252706 [Mycena rebaudengoi]